ncbi:MAG: RagB/SusD family nutrient uptake outer membrane protein [Phocaeicola sp.]
MKLRKLYIYVFCGITLSMSSCEGFLREDPLDRKVDENYWKTKADAEAGVNALYLDGAPRLNEKAIDGGWTPNATMWGGIASGLYVDKRKDRSFTKYSEEGNFVISVFDEIGRNYWRELYLGTARANKAIKKLPGMTDVLDGKTIENYVAQAKFFRAYNYFWLVKEFGGVPYITEPYESTDGMYIPRSTAEEVYKGIEQDLLEIVDGDALPEKAFYSNKGRVTKSMAQTLLAQVYLQWAGAPVNGGNEYYTKAAEMAKKVIEGGQHALEQNDAFNVIKTSKSSTEIIYAREYNRTSYNFGNDYACRSIEKEAFSNWKDKNGNSVFRPGGDVLYNAYLPATLLTDSYDNDDIRGQEKQFFFKEYVDATGEKHTLKNYGNWLWFDDVSLKNGRTGDNNMPIFRYAEVLLIAAEGYARTGKEDVAKNYLNEVRTRAKVAPETATGEELVHAILTERLHELPLEFKAWDDIRRTRLYPEAANEAGKLNWTPLESAAIQNKPEEGSTTVGAIPTYALLWPIPLREMQANPALTQNSGW